MGTQTFIDEIRALTKNSQEQLIHEYFNENVLNNIKNAIKKAAAQGEDGTIITLSRCPFALANRIEVLLKNYFPGFHFLSIQQVTLNDLNFNVHITWNIKEEES